MRISKQQLRKIIREEAKRALRENDRYFDRPATRRPEKSIRYEKLVHDLDRSNVMRVDFLDDDTLAIATNKIVYYVHTDTRWHVEDMQTRMHVSLDEIGTSILIVDVEILGRDLISLIDYDRNTYYVDGKIDKVVKSYE